MSVIRACGFFFCRGTVAVCGLDAATRGGRQRLVQGALPGNWRRHDNDALRTPYVEVCCNPTSTIHRRLLYSDVCCTPTSTIHRRLLYSGVSCTSKCDIKVWRIQTSAAYRYLFHVDFYWLSTSPTYRRLLDIDACYTRRLLFAGLYRELHVDVCCILTCRIPAIPQCQRPLYINVCWFL